MTVGKSIRIDLHNHTHYSPDSILSPKQFVREARRHGLDVVAVTDHNTIRGALAVRELADSPVIIGEEVRSKDGEILGLFLSDEIPKGLSAGDTIACIKNQGGIVGVPHPFDSLRSALREDALLAHIDQIDFIEGLNARMVFPSHNAKAREFAAATRTRPGKSGGFGPRSRPSKGRPISSQLSGRGVSSGGAQHLWCT